MTSNSLLTVSKPKWIELRKLRNRETCDAVAKCLFGFKPKKSEYAHPEPYKAGEFVRRFDIDITRLKNFYGEVDQVFAPIGPLTPASKRLLIKPILAIEQVGDEYKVQGLEMSTGFFSRDKSIAWVPLDEYMDMVGDPYFEDMEEGMKKTRAVILEKVKAMQKDGFEEDELALWEKVRNGAEFDELNQEELGVLSRIMQKLRGDTPDV